MEEKILKYFGDLKYKEQKDLYAKITFLLKRKDKFVLQENMLYQILLEKLAKITGGKYIAFALFKKTKNYSEFKKAVDSLDDFLLRALKQEEVQRQYRTKFYRLCVDLVIKEMEEKNMELFMRSILYYFKNVPALINVEAPGYVKAGLFKMLLKAYCGEKGEIS